MFSPFYLKIFEKSPFLMKTPTQNFAHHTGVKKHPFGVKTPILATLNKKIRPTVKKNPPITKGDRKLSRRSKNFMDIYLLKN